MTGGHVLVLGLRLAGMDGLDSVPDSYRGTLRDKRRWLHRLAEQVVDRCWLAPTAEDIRRVGESMKDHNNAAPVDDDCYPYCVCQECEFLS